MLHAMQLWQYLCPTAYQHDTDDWWAYSALSVYQNTRCAQPSRDVNCCIAKYLLYVHTQKERYVSTRHWTHVYTCL